MTVALTLRNDGDELGRLIDFAEAFADRHRLSTNDKARLLIVLEELFTNVVNHGYDSAAVRGRIEVALSCRDGRVTIDFSDDGRPFDPLAEPLPDLNAPLESHPIGGLGILLLRSLVDDARYRREGSRNHLVLARNVAICA
jgi:anti-sigma regulatory factor (Ser/Thr protein kinase)